MFEEKVLVLLVSPVSSDSHVANRRQTLTDRSSQKGRAQMARLRSRALAVRCSLDQCLCGTNSII
eukprot:1755645-Amphidinium_carterae.2